MFSKIAALKDTIWAFCIVVCLAAVLVGLVAAMFGSYDGEQQRQTVVLGAQSAAPEADEALAPPITLTGDGQLHQLEETADAGQVYMDSAYFLVDSALIGLRDYGLLSGGTGTQQVWGSVEGNIPASTVASPTIRYPGDGSQISAVDAAMIVKPGRLYISLGMDGLDSVTADEFAEGYRSLVSSLRSVSPDTVIVCCSVTSVTVSYSGTDALTSTVTNAINDAIRQVCVDTGVYYLDLAAGVCDSSGSMLDGLSSSNGKTLNSEGLNRVIEYIRTHALSQEG